MNYSFSVIVTCFNHETHLHAMMEMLHAQTCQNFEVILIDNASSDNSREVLNQLGESSKLKCSVILNDENIGLCRAFNQGLANANGKNFISLTPNE